MPNPDPVQSEKFLQQRFEHPSDLPEGVRLARTPRCVRLPEVVDAAVLGIPKKERSAWIRQAICKAAVEQGLIAAIE